MSNLPVSDITPSAISNSGSVSDIGKPTLHFDDQHYPPASADLLKDCNYLCGTKPICKTPVYDDLGAVCCMCGHYSDCHVTVRFTV